jgi:hypothetical protein
MGNPSWIDARSRRATTVKGTWKWLAASNACANCLLAVLQQDATAHQTTDEPRRRFRRASLRWRCAPHP